MREISPQLLASIASGATTFCSCWRLTRRDGIVLGFTDHDRDISFEGAVFAAMSGLESSAFESSAGLSVGGAEVSGALSAQALSEADLSNGLFDGARVEVFRVDWSAPDNKVLLEAGVIGEVRRSEHAFTAELRSLAHELDQERGRLYQAGCDADVGDARCGFAFAIEPFVFETQVLPDQMICSLFFSEPILQMIGSLEEGLIFLTMAMRVRGQACVRIAPTLIRTWSLFGPDLASRRLPGTGFGCMLDATRLSRRVA